MNQLSKMLKTATILSVSFAFVLTACQNNSEQSADENSPGVSSPSPEAAVGPAMSYEEWEDSFPDAPWADLYQDGWSSGKELSLEYTYRTTPPNVERTMEGNLYLQGWPIVKDKVKLKIMAPQSALMSGDVEDNFIIKNLEKQMNIEFEWIMVPEAEYADKVNVVLASGDLPDIIWGAYFNPAQEMKFGEEEKLLIPLNDLIDKYGSNIKKVFDLRPEVKKAVTTPSGNIYSLPFVYYNYHVRYPMKGWINKVWLDKLNLQVPTTTEEYEKALQAFKTQDPNGNGKPDEIPLAAMPGGWSTDLTGYLMNPFVLNIGDHTFVENGQVKFAPATSEYKEGLKWLSSLYSQKLFSSEVFTMKAEQFTQLGLADPQVLGSYPGGYFGVALGNSTTGGVTNDFVAMPPLKGPSGNAYTFYDPSNYAGGAFAITKACKNPEVAMRLADWFSSDAGFMAAIYGRLGEEWAYADEGDKNYLKDGQAQWKKIKDTGPNNIMLEYMRGPYAGPTEETKLAMASTPGSEYDTRMTELTEKLYKGHEMPEILPLSMYATAEDADEMTQIFTSIGSYVNEMAAMFITGKKDIDKDWDKYVAEFEKMNLSRYLELKQQQYDAYKGG